MRLIGFVFQHQMDVAAGVAGLDFPADGFRQFGQDMGLAVVDDRMHGVEPQPVEAVLVQPVQGVVDEVIADGTGVLAVEIDRRTPGRMVPFGEEGLGVGAEIVTFRAEVVVDHVQEDHQVAAMRLVDQALQVVRGAVGIVGGIGQNAVVTPSPASREVGQRQELDRGDAEIGQMVQLAADAVIGALVGEAADVEFIQDGLFPRAAAPIRVPPFVAFRIDHEAGAVDVLRLEAGRGVGHREAIGQQVLVPGSGGCLVGHQFEPPIRLSGHRLGVVLPAIQDDTDFRLGGSPKAKARRAIVARFGTERHRVCIAGGHRGGPSWDWADESPLRTAVCRG